MVYLHYVGSSWSSRISILSQEFKNWFICIISEHSEKYFYRKLFKLNHLKISTFSLTVCSKAEQRGHLHTKPGKPSFRPASTNKQNKINLLTNKQNRISLASNLIQKKYH